MKERILQVLKDASNPLSYEQIDSLLGINTIDETKEMYQIMNELEKDAIIYRTKKDKYMLFGKSNLYQGILSVNKKGFGFVDRKEDPDNDIFISIDNMNGALHGDRVIVEVLEKKEDGRLEGKILRVIERNLSTIVGEVHFKDGKAYIIPDDKKVKIDIEVPLEKTKNAVEGHKVVVRLVKPLGPEKYSGEIEEIIGHKNDPGVDILSIIYQHNIKCEFDKETLKELEKIPGSVSEKDKVGRRDLTNEVIFTIDGDDTKDIDDAISIKKLENGNYELGVHIADVSYYVKEGSALDREAMERGTSVYLVDRVIPMLPHQLSNGICSLNPGVDRLAISCVMEIDSNGKTVDYDIFESVIRSRIQMTYKKVNQVLEQNVIPEGYEDYADKLRLMENLSHIIREAKVKRGSLDFDVDEPKILVDENCHPIEVVLRERGTGEKLIEDFMIQANECVATHIFYMDLPFIYRVHEYPKEEKIRDFLSYLQTLGYTYHGNVKDIKPKSIQKLLDFLRDKKEFKILSNQMLRNMQKAVYLPQNLGHYGLASTCYTHFTSPIRRYPDTTVHRLLRTYLFNKDLSPETLSHWEEKLVYIAEHSSATERASVDCERDVEDMKMAEYMEDHIGEEFKGMISSVTNFGMFVQLENLIEGLVHVNELKEYFRYDEIAQTLTGEKTNMQYRLGDEVIVRATRASKEEKAIDFEIVKKLTLR